VKVQTIALFCVFVILLSTFSVPLSYAQQQPQDIVGQQRQNIGQLRNEIRQFGEDIQPGVATGSDEAGEDIIINVAGYHPITLRTSLLEEQNVNVFAQLTGLPANPAISIPRIQSVQLRASTVKTEPEGKQAAIGALQYIAPKDQELSFDNLGYIAIPIRRIPREVDVPDKITINADARIFFDVGSILGVGPNQDVLLEQTESEWRAEQEGHRFFAGYIRASEIKEDQASFVLYDLAGRQQRTEPITLRIGVASPILSSTQTFGNPRSLFDRFTVRLEEVKEVEDRVKLLIKRDGRDDIVSVLSVGEFLYPGSLWRVEDIREQEGRGVVQLKRIDNKVDPIFLTFPGSAQRRENRQKVGPQAQSAPTPPNQTKAAPAQTPEDQLRDKYEEMVKEFEDLKSRLGYIGKKDFQAVTDRFSEVYKGAKPATLKNNARDKLLEIRDIYTTEITNLGPPIDTEIESESKEQELRNFYRNKILSINSLLTEVVREADIITIDESARNQNYRAAIQEYRKVVDQHQDVLDDDDRPLGMKALLRAANIYFKIGDTTQALQTYQEVINKYADKLSAAEKGAIELEKAVIETGRSIQGSKAVIVQERDTQVTILPIDLATTMENKPSATLLINGKTVTYKEGDEVTALNQNIAGGYSWYIADIDSKRVLLRAGNTNLQRPLDESLPFGRVTKVKPSQQEGEVSIRVARIDLKRQAKVTILPASERAFTETSFTLHIPIEKRPFDLPLFSESLDKEIQNTQQLIEKLDKVITNVRRIHEFWIKFCYITFGVLWTKNLITGFQGAGVARQQIREKWENKYQEYRAKTTSSGGIPQSFDSFIIQNAKEYNQDQKLAQNIVGEIRNQNGEWKKIQTDFKLDEERAKALYFKSKFIQNDPTIKNKMGTILLEAKEESVKQQVQKDLEVTKNQEQLKNLFVNAGAINQDDFQDPTKFSVFYEQNKPLLESQYKDIKLQQAREEYLKNQEGLKEDLNRLKVGVGDAGPIKDSELTDIYRNTKASALPQKQGLQTISRFEVFRDTKNGEMKLLGGSDNLFGDNACNSKLTQNYELKKDYYVKTQTGCQGIQITDVTSVTAQHKKFLSLYNSGNDKGKIKQISIDSELYAEVGYTTGGRVKDVEVFSRFDPNAELGTGRREGTIEDTLAKYRRLQSNQKSKEITDRLAALQKVEGLVQTCNRNAATKIALTPGTALGGDCGTVTNPAQEEVKTGCVDYMSPGDCRLLFNACDPVICPASRCNAGGRWQVSSVPQTGIIGSVTLCLPNFPEVAFPVCVTGILAGLENIHSILQGYGECLKVSKVQGRSVGICDRVRNVFICETIWREAIAIFNVEGGLLGFIAKKFDKATGGGGEYATFKKSFQDSAGSLKFFTQDYAKNVFAAYAGDSLEEIGTEICKAAVFGKVPAPGDFIDQITRPESPPQVIAFFDEIPFSDIPTTPQSQYSVFFHVYAGENEDILFSLYLQATTEDGRQITNLPRVYVVRNRRVEKGDFFDGNPDRLLASGYNEICIEMRSQTRGLFQECGFGKVTTDYGLNVLTDIVTANKARKQITSAKECVPERGTFTSNDAIASSLGVFSTGLAQTGIIRKCSGYDPDVGTSQDNWAEVGVCGKDEGGRDLGVCYVFLPQIREALKDVVRENTTIQAIQQQREDLAQTKLKERLGILGQEQIGELFIQALEAKARLSYTEAVNLFRQVAGAGDKKKAARAQFEIGRIYEIIADAAIKEGEGCATIESKELCDQNKQCYWQTYSEGSLGVGTSVCLSKRGESVSQPVCTPILSIEKVVQGDISDPISQGDVLSYLTYVTEGDEVLIQANFKGCDLKSGTPVRFELAELLGGTDGLKVMESQDLTLIERTDERKVRLTVGKPSKEQGEVFGRLIFEGRTLVSNSIPIKGSPISTPTEQEVPEIKEEQPAQPQVQESALEKTKPIVQPHQTLDDIRGVIPKDLINYFSFLDIPHTEKDFIHTLTTVDRNAANYAKIIFRIGKDYRINPLLIASIVKAESNWDEKAVSNKDARGLMQLTDAAINEIINHPAGMRCIKGELNSLKEKPFDPSKNIEAGVCYYDYLLRSYPRKNGLKGFDDPAIALAAYNAGPARIDSGAIPKESYGLVSRVVDNLRAYGVDVKEGPLPDIIYPMQIEDSVQSATESQESSLSGPTISSFAQLTFQEILPGDILKEVSSDRDQPTLTGINLKVKDVTRNDDLITVTFDDESTIQGDYNNPIGSNYISDGRERVLVSNGVYKGFILYRLGQSVVAGVKYNSDKTKSFVSFNNENEIWISSQYIQGTTHNETVKDRELNLILHTLAGQPFQLQKASQAVTPQPQSEDERTSGFSQAQESLPDLTMSQLALPEESPKQTRSQDAVQQVQKAFTFQEILIGDTVKEVFSDGQASETGFRAKVVRVIRDGEDIELELDDNTVIMGTYNDQIRRNYLVEGKQRVLISEGDYGGFVLFKIGPSIIFGVRYSADRTEDLVSFSTREGKWVSTSTVQGRLVTEPVKDSDLNYELNTLRGKPIQTEFSTAGTGIGLLGCNIDEVYFAKDKEGESRIASEEVVYEGTKVYIILKKTGYCPAVRVDVLRDVAFVQDRIAKSLSFSFTDVKPSRQGRDIILDGPGLQSTLERMAQHARNLSPLLSGRFGFSMPLENLRKQIATKYYAETYRNPIDQDSAKINSQDIYILGVNPIVAVIDDINSGRKPLDPLPTNSQLLQNIKRYQSSITKASKEYNVDESLIAAVMAQESGAGGSLVETYTDCDSCGLMQVTSIVIRDIFQNRLGDFRFDDMRNLNYAENQVLAGTAYLRLSLDRFGGSEELALAAYNLGPTRLNNLRRDCVKNPQATWKEVITSSSISIGNGQCQIPRETLEYVPSVLKYKAEISPNLGGFD